MNLTINLESKEINDGGKLVINGEDINLYLKNINLNIDTINHPLIKGGFKDYNDYNTYYNSGKKTGKARLKNKIEKLKDHLFKEYGKDIDPIEYLIYLYYGLGLSIIDVSKIIYNKGWENLNNTSLEKTFKQTFGWELRDSVGSEVSNTKRQKNGQINRAKEITHNKIDEKYKKLKEAIFSKTDAILSINTTTFDKESFEKLYKIGKILYILYFFYGINRKEIIKLKDERIGARVISKKLNEKFEGKLKELNIVLIIHPKDIQSILNET